MADYRQYVNALRKCAKEHKDEMVPFAHIRTEDLCNDVAKLLEHVETDIVDAVFITKEATVGEVLKGLFPDEEVVETDSACVYFGAKMRIDKDLWNSPYKKGDKESSDK